MQEKPATREGGFAATSVTFRDLNVLKLSVGRGRRGLTSDQSAPRNSQGLNASTRLKFRDFAEMERPLGGPPPKGRGPRSITRQTL
jgi:hypothetical protein